MLSAGKVVCLKAALFYTWATAWFLDTFFTTQFVAQHGLLMEANPLMRWVLANWGTHGFIAIKVIFILIWYRLHQRAWLWAHAVVTIPTIYAAVLGAIIVIG